MTVIGNKGLRKMIQDQGLISSYRDMDSQITANGFDLRLAALIEVDKAGELRIDKKSARKPVLGHAYIMEGMEDAISGIACKETEIISEGELVDLESSRTYLAVTCEKINAGEGLNFELEPRSSLFRYCQCGLINGFGEAGYKGRLTVLFKPFLDGAAIDMGVRFIQVCFNRLDSKEHYENQKESNYQDGRIL